MPKKEKMEVKTDMKQRKTLREYTHTHTHTQGELISKKEKNKMGAETMNNIVMPFLCEKKGITLIALVITILLHYDEIKKCSNINRFLLSANC